MKRIAILTAAAFALAAGSAFAADKAKTKDNDPGFNVLDKDNDGYVTRAEATGNPHLMKHFKEADKNTDGKLNRAEYLWVMTKKDVSTATSKVEKKLQNTEDKAKSQSSAGGTK